MSASESNDASFFFFPTPSTSHIFRDEFPTCRKDERSMNCWMSHWVLRHSHNPGMIIHWHGLIKIQHEVREPLADNAMIYLTWRQQVATISMDKTQWSCLNQSFRGPEGRALSFLSHGLFVFTYLTVRSESSLTFLIIFTSLFTTFLHIRNFT